MTSTDEKKRFQEVLQRFKEELQDPLRLEALISILKLVFYAGLEKKEATDLKIEDILQGDKADQIALAPGENPIQISEEVKSALLEYSWALQTWSMPSNSPLYSRYFQESGRKTLDRDLKLIQKIKFDQLRRAGAKHHYKMLLRDVGDSEAKEEIGRKFRLSERTIKDILGDTTQPAGEKAWEEQPPNVKLMEIIEQQEGLSTSDIFITNRVPELVDECFKILDEMEELKSKKYRYQIKESFLDDIIRQPLSWAVKNVKRVKKNTSQTLFNTPGGFDLIDRIKTWDEIGSKDREKRWRREKKEWMEKRKKYYANFEDRVNTHRPKQKLDVKKKKLFNFIKKIKATLTEEDKSKILKGEGELEELRKVGKKKKREQPWMTFLPEKWQKRSGIVDPEGVFPSIKRVNVEDFWKTHKIGKNGEKPNIRIGIVESGGTDEEEQYFIKAWSLARKRINAAGGVKGILIEVIMQPGISLKEFVERYNVLALIGPIRSTYIQMISNEVKSIGIPMAIGGTDVILTQQGNPWLFRCRPDDSLVSKAMVEYIRDDLKHTRVGILHDSDVFGTGGADLVEQGCNRGGLIVVKKENYTTGQTGHTLQLQSLKDAGAQVMVVYGTNPEDVALIQQQYRDLGSPYEYLGSPSSGMRVCLQLSGKAAEGLAMIGDYVPSRRATKKYANKYREEYKLSNDFLDEIEAKDLAHYNRLLHYGEMDPTAAWCYDALRILARGVKLGGMDRKKIMKTILTIKDYEGVLGTYSFTPNGDGLHKVSVIRIENGRHVAIKTY